MTDDLVLTSSVNDYTASTINLALPHVPPSQWQHDLLIPTLFQRAGTALQIGVGYGALVYALEELGYFVYGLDINLDLWHEARSRMERPSPGPKVVPGDVRLQLGGLVRRDHDLIVADFCGAFRDRTMYDASLMWRMHQCLAPRGVLSFNLGVVPHIATTAFRNATMVFGHVLFVPGTQVMLASDSPLDIDPRNITTPEPDWLCSTSNLYGEADLP